MARATGSNQFDAEQISRFLDAIDREDDTLLTLASDHMAKCKGPRARIRDTMKAAKEAGLNMASFRTVVAQHRSERKIEEKIAKLEEDDHADFLQMKEALGEFLDTPLGQAAVDRHPAARSEDLDNLSSG